jgi:opacity protein-like surface antigen
MKRILSKSILASLLCLASTYAFAFLPTSSAASIFNAVSAKTAAQPETTTTAPATPASSLPNKIIYGLDEARDFDSKVAANFYIQVGSFKSKTNAEKLSAAIKANTDKPVSISSKGGLYIIKMGPFKTPDEVRTISEALIAVLPKFPTPPVHKIQQAPEQPDMVTNDTTSSTDVWLDERSNWYLQALVGAERPLVVNTMTPNNGFPFFPPNNVDSFFTKTRWAVAAGAGAGKRFQTGNHWIPAYSLGLRYQHYFKTNVGQQVSEFSEPDFTDYTYNWTISSDIVMFAIKMNLVQWGHFSPFINGGAGWSFNHATNFYETPLPGVDPRPDPGFLSNTTCRFTYSFGAGVDWQIHDKFIVSLDYEFQDMGALYSGNGANNFGSSNLFSKTYQSNNILLSLTYLLGK